MKNILEYIRTEIAKVCEISQEVPFVCEYPRDKLHGDFATNIAMVASKIEKKSPIELAERFVLLIKTLPFVCECTVAKPAFINIRVNDSIFLEMMETIVEAKNLPDIGKSQKINIEYVSANPTGPLHVGHLRGAIYGDVLATLLFLSFPLYYIYELEGDFFSFIIVFLGFFMSSII